MSSFPHLWRLAVAVMMIAVPSMTVPSPMMRSVRSASVSPASAVSVCRAYSRRSNHPPPAAALAAETLSLQTSRPTWPGGPAVIPWANVE